MNLKEFRNQYPNRTLTLRSGKPFVYRYAKKEGALATLVLLTGGIGLSDLFYLHFAEFAKEFSVLTFDYQIQFADNAEFADASAELFEALDERVWLVGQSLGGIVAQIIAANHPQRVEGLVLSNTCSLAEDMGEAAYAHLNAMAESTAKSKKLLSLIPFGLYKRLVKFVVMKKKTDGLTAEERAVMAGLCDAMLELLTKPYEFHMLDFLADAKNHLGMTKEDFARWEDRVLLILSEDDDTFIPPCKESLIRLMSHPRVVTHLTGGHLALLIKSDQYAALVSDYIRCRS